MSFKNFKIYIGFCYNVFNFEKVGLIINLKGVIFLVQKGSYINYIVMRVLD